MNLLPIDFPLYDFNVDEFIATNLPKIQRL